MTLAPRFNVKVDVGRHTSAKKYSECHAVASFSSGVPNGSARPDGSRATNPATLSSIPTIDP